MKTRKDLTLIFFIGYSMKRNAVDEFKLVLLIRLTNLKQLYEEIESFYQLTRGQVAVSQFIKLLSIIVMATHIFGCMFYLVGIENKDSTKNWIYVSQINDDPWLDQYIASAYWSMVTIISVGYGDIHPQCTKERLFVTFMILASSTITGYTINKIGEILDQFDIHERKVKQNMIEVTKHLNSVNISKQLQLKIKKQLEFIFESQLKEKIEGKMILSNISYNLQCQYKQDVYGKLLKSKDNFKNFFSDDFFYELSLIVEEKTFMPEEIIYTIDDPSNQFYLIVAGEVELTPFDLHSKQHITPNLIQNLKKGDIFGYEEFVCQSDRRLIAVAKTITSTGSIDYTQFYELVKKFPQEFVNIQLFLISNMLNTLLQIQSEKFCMIRDNANHQKVFDQLINLSCLCCSKDDHQTQLCPSLHYSVNRKNLIEKFCYSKNQSRQQTSQRKELKSQKWSQTINGLKNAQVKLKQNTDLLKDLRKGMTRRQNRTVSQIVGSEQNIQPTFNTSETESDSSYKSGVQFDQPASNREIPYVKQLSKVQEIDLLDQAIKSISNCDTNSYKSRTVNINPDEIKKSNKLQQLYLTQKSREQIKKQLSNTPSISNTNESFIEIHEQKVDEKQSSETFIVDKKLMQDTLQISEQSHKEDYASVTNQTHIDDRKQRISIISIPESINKVVQFQEQQNIVVIKPNSSNPSPISRQSVRYAPRKSEYFKSRKIGQNSTSNLILDTQGNQGGYFIGSNQSRYELDPSEHLRYDKDSLAETATSNHHKHKKFVEFSQQGALGGHLRHEDERQQAKYFDENNGQQYSYGLDIIKSYKYYFPHNNINNVLHLLQQIKVKKGIQLKKFVFKKVIRQKKID